MAHWEYRNLHAVTLEKETVLGHLQQDSYCRWNRKYITHIPLNMDSITV